ncbi:MAG: S53 family peptidase [Nocardioides sp.]
MYGLGLWGARRRLSSTLAGIATIVAALAVLPATSPVAAVSPPTGQASLAGLVAPGEVRLISGDVVVVRSGPHGQPALSLKAGSPSFGKPLQVVRTATAVYAIPQLSKQVGYRLDVSMFNLTRLQGYAKADSVPVVVEFAAGARAGDVPGLAVESGREDRTVSGSRGVVGSYRPGSVGVGAMAGAGWSRVRLVSLPVQDKAGVAARTGVQLRTLTVKVDDGGAPAAFGFVFIANLDDPRLFSDSSVAFEGEARVAVPEGNYVVAVRDPFTGLRFVGTAPEVRADKTVRVDFADATVAPRVSVPGAVLGQWAYEWSAYAESGDGALSLGIASDGEVTAVANPMPSLKVGRVNVRLLASHGAGGNRSFVTADEWVGVPRTMVRRHEPDEFAQAPVAVYGSTTPDRVLFIVGCQATQFFCDSIGQPFEAPQRKDIRVLAGTTEWGFSVQAFYDDLASVEFDYDFATYRAGEVAPEVGYLLGPVGAGVEVGLNRRLLGECLWCRDGDVLRGAVPLWSPADSRLPGSTSLFGPSLSSWSLSTAGGKVIDRGRPEGQPADLISPSVTLPATKQGYRLHAETKLRPSLWDLSSRVTTDWEFTSQRGDTAIGLLMPSYVPTRRLDQTIAGSRVEFGLDFGNVGPVNRRVATAAVRYGTDGAGWKNAAVTRVDDNSFTVSYPNPVGAKHVNLQVTGTDAAGFTVTETAIHAYRLPAGLAAASAAGTEVTMTPSAVMNPNGACRGTTTRCGVVVERPGVPTVAADARGRAPAPEGWGAGDLRDAYDVPASTGRGQTVGVVVGAHYPTAEKDLAVYRKQFGLPPCTKASGCFTQINQRGQTGNYPDVDPGWALEAALDLQMVSAACPQCRLVLAEADEPSDTALAAATDAAVAAGAKVTNHSYGITENTVAVRSASHYAQPGVTAVVATGDSGYTTASFPATVPKAIAVGGTTLTRADNWRGWRERAWQFGGSGCSAYFNKPADQTDKLCGKRTVADVSAVAENLAIYDTTEFFDGSTGWFVVGGTSASAPFVAGLIAGANAGGKSRASLLGDHSGFRDITTGDNVVFRSCGESYLCKAKPGYDAPTGWGSPRGAEAFR